MYFGYKYYYYFINQSIIIFNNLISSFFKLIINSIYNIKLIKKSDFLTKLHNVYTYFYIFYLFQIIKYN